MTWMLLFSKSLNSSPFLAFCSTIDWAAFHRECSAHLPSYARPAFVRVTPEMALTSTFKHQKGGFAKDGYDLNKVTDRVFFYNPKDGKVVPLTPEIASLINTGGQVTLGVR
jgi:hypothetical protein